MADHRPGRGPEPRDRALFGEGQPRALRRAVHELSWLLGRGYPPDASLALVGNRYGLTRRQRKAVRGASASAAEVETRARGLREGPLEGRPVWVDGFNALITTERALGGAPVFVGLDGAKRDVAGIHGSYRLGPRTDAALVALGEELAARGAGPVTWLLDRPVSNSGRLAARIRALAVERGWPWEARAVHDPDGELVASTQLVASSDAYVLDRCAGWVDLVGGAIARAAPEAWVIDLRLAPGVPGDG